MWDIIIRIKCFNLASREEKTNTIYPNGVASDPMCFYLNHWLAIKLQIVGKLSNVHYGFFNCSIIIWTHHVEWGSQVERDRTLRNNFLNYV